VLYLQNAVVKIYPDDVRHTGLPCSAIALVNYRNCTASIAQWT